MRLKAQGLTTAGRKRGPEKMPMAALQLLAVMAYCLRRRALPSTFFRPAWPGMPVRTTGALMRFAGVLVCWWPRERKGLRFFWRRFWHFDHPNFRAEFAAVQHKFHREIS
jgi:hypothetical protein